MPDSELLGKRFLRNLMLCPRPQLPSSSGFPPYLAIPRSSQGRVPASKQDHFFSLFLPLVAWCGATMKWTSLRPTIVHTCSTICQKSHERSFWRSRPAIVDQRWAISTWVAQGNERFVLLVRQVDQLREKMIAFLFFMLLTCVSVLIQK